MEIKYIANRVVQGTQKTFRGDGTYEEEIDLMPIFSIGYPNWFINNFIPTSGIQFGIKIVTNNENEMGKFQVGKEYTLTIE